MLGNDGSATTMIGKAIWRTLRKGLSALKFKQKAEVDNSNTIQVPPVVQPQTGLLEPTPAQPDMIKSTHQQANAIEPISLEPELREPKALTRTIIKSDSSASKVSKNRRPREGLRLAPRRVRQQLKIHAENIPEKPRKPVGSSKARGITKPTSDPFFWDLPAEAAVREPPPNSIDSGHQETFEEILRVGSRSTDFGKGEELFVTIGIDFGTSSSKVIARFPYESGGPTFAIPAPQHCRSDGHPYLWQTVLWVRENGDFVAWPEPGAPVLHSLKQGIMDGRHDNVIETHDVNDLDISRADSVVAYLTYVIRYARGWLLANRSDAFLNRTPIWFENVGLPAASLNKVELVEAFRTIVAAARLLADSGRPINSSKTKFYLESEDASNAGVSPEAAEALGLAIIPETAAEASGFFQSGGATKGTFFMVDVGAMTMDVCTFGFRDNSYQLFTAMVKPLGVESMHWFIDAGKSEESFRDQCERCVRRVIWDAKNEYIPQVECWKPGRELPVFLVGGGAKNELHLQITKALSPWLRKFTPNNGIRLLKLKIPPKIDLPEPIDSFERLAVAWGLSLRPDQIGEFLLSDEVPKFEKSPERSLDERFISKEQV